MWHLLVRQFPDMVGDHSMFFVNVFCFLLVQFGAVNCDVEAELCQRYHITSVPAIMLFPFGDKSYVACTNAVCSWSVRSFTR